MITENFNPLRFDYEVDSDTITIEGIRYAGEFFRYLAYENSLPLNQHFKIVKRENAILQSKP